MDSLLETKLKSLNELRESCSTLKSQGKKIIHCHGVFDLLHLGHIRYLQAARKYGDILVVSLTADQFVNRGPGRPVFKQDFRAESLANLEIVDFVTIVHEPTAIEAILAISPNYYVKGSDYKDKQKDVTGQILNEEQAVASCGGSLVFTDEITFSSSQLINLYFDSYPPSTIRYLRACAEHITAEQIIEKLKVAQDLRVLVIGDTIIDQYHYSTAMGRSAKESIVAHRYQSAEDFAGGALATANHVAEIVKNVDLLTVLGSVETHEEFIREHLSPNITPKFFYRPGAVTTVKRRYVTEDGSRKLFEVVFMDDHPLSKREEQEICAQLEKTIRDYDLVVVSDFGHGFLTKELIELICANSRTLAVNAQTNSANIGFNFVTRYPRADFICIDEPELRYATQDKFGDLTSVIAKLSQELECEQIVATRGAAGSISFSCQKGFHEAPAFTHLSVDKLGAGDAFFAYAAVCYALQFPQELLSLVGNAVGSLKVQIIGNREPVRFANLAKYITRLLRV